MGARFVLDTAAGRATVMAVYDVADTRERGAALRWYPAFRERIVQESRILTTAQSIALFAVLSQQAQLRVNWQNFRLLAHDPAYAGPLAACTERMRAKCREIVADPVNPLQYAVGPKISRFAANLSGNLDVVTVDRHMQAIVTGDQSHLLSPTQYTRLEVLYQSIAADVGMPPATLQALLWLTWRRLRGIVDSADLWAA